MKQLIQMYLAYKIFEIKQNPITWASGIKAPFYCDNRLILSYPDLWDLIMEQMIKHYQQHFEQADTIAAVATGGIAHGAALARQLKKPLLYIRSQTKDHGLKKHVEGSDHLLEKNCKVLVIEDLISTGASSIEACQHLCQAPVQIVGLMSIFDYQLQKSQQCIHNFIRAYPDHTKNFKQVSIITLSDLIMHHPFSGEQLTLIHEFISEYGQ